MKDESLGSVKLSRLKKIIEAAEKYNHDDVDMDISFEYLVGSCFPKVLENVQNKMSYIHTQGYIQGREDMKNEIEGNN